MFESPVNKIDLIIFSIFATSILFVIFLTSHFDGRTKIIFCNVGQGDATYIRIQNKIDVLIDAGPDKSVLSCLGKYMPFWDRKIELAFLSHPNSDHYNGYFFINDRYKIDEFITVNSPVTPKTYKQLIEKITNKNIKIKEAVQLRQPACRQAGQAGCDEAKFTIVWPPKNFNSSNDNDFSSVILFECCSGISQRAKTILFTGDASPFVLSRLSHGAIGKVDILKVPHHGSKNGLTKNFLDLADPKVAVISVGKNNSYGHPSQKVLDMLKAKNINIKRTDVEGDIVFNLKE